MYVMDVGLSCVRFTALRLQARARQGKDDLTTGSTTRRPRHAGDAGSFSSFLVHNLLLMLFFDGPSPRMPKVAAHCHIACHIP